MTGKTVTAAPTAGPVHMDHYGRSVPKGAHGSTHLGNPTNLGSSLITAAVELFDRIVNKSLTVRRITLAANRVVQDEGIYQFDLFTDTEKQEKEKNLQKAMLGIKKKYGKNAVLKARISWTVLPCGTGTGRSGDIKQTDYTFLSFCFIIKLL